jgi:hypothetical protein
VGASTPAVCFPYHLVQQVASGGGGRPLVGGVTLVVVVEVEVEVVGPHHLRLAFARGR